MAFGRRNNAVVTKTTKPTLMTSLRGPNAKTRTTKTTTTIEPTHHQHHAHTGAGTTHSHNHGTRSAAAHNTRTTRSSGYRTAAQPAVHHRRKASIGDKISGAMMKLKGSLTHRPGLKAAGTRRQNGTDGRGSYRAY